MTALAEAEAAGADLSVFPELAITGYPPEDLLAQAGVRGRQPGALCHWIADASGRAPPGRLRPRPPRPPGLPNAAAVCAGAGSSARYRKRLLPNYGVFDEQRWFTPGAGRCPFRRGRGAGRRLHLRGRVVRRRPGGRQARPGAVVVNLNASPYSRGRRPERLAVLRACGRGGLRHRLRQPGRGPGRAGLRRGVPGGGRRRRVVAAAPQFDEEVLVVDLDVPAPAPRAGGDGRGRLTAARPGGRRPPRCAALARAARPGGRGLRGAGAGDP